MGITRGGGTRVSRLLPWRLAASQPVPGAASSCSPFPVDSLGGVTVLVAWRCPPPASWAELTLWSRWLVVSWRGPLHLSHPMVGPKDSHMWPHGLKRSKTDLLIDMSAHRTRGEARAPHIH